MFVCMYIMHGHICLCTRNRCKSMGNLVNISMYLYMCLCMYICVDMYMCMNDCFMYVRMCIYCVCMYFMTRYSAVRIPLASNCAI